MAEETARQPDLETCECGFIRESCSKCRKQNTAIRNWTEVGKEYDHEVIIRTIDSLEWKALPLTLDFMNGEGIKAAIKGFRIAKVSHVATSPAMAPCGFFGIRGHFANGDAEFYLIDEGSELVPVCSDFHPKA